MPNVDEYEHKVPGLISSTRRASNHLLHFFASSIFFSSISCTVLAAALSLFAACLADFSQARLALPSSADLQSARFRSSLASATFLRALYWPSDWASGSALRPMPRW